IASSLSISPEWMMVWFGTVVAVTLQTAYLSPPVAMSAYYLKQVVREWPLLTIYKGMFEFMTLQILAIGLVIVFPAIALWLPQYLQAQSQATQTEQVEEATTLEDYQTPGGYGEALREALEEAREGAAAQDGQQGGAESLEQDDLSKP